MDQIHRIRELFYEQGKNLNEIAIIMNCDWRTVRKYVDMEDFSSPPANSAALIPFVYLTPIALFWLALFMQQTHLFPSSHFTGLISNFRATAYTQMLRNTATQNFNGIKASTPHTTSIIP